MLILNNEDSLDNVNKYGLIYEAMMLLIFLLYSVTSGVIVFNLSLKFNLIQDSCFAKFTMVKYC